MKISRRSYAKINLILKILNKRLDGYHDIVTLFTKISLFDTINIALSDKFKISCNDSSVPVDNNNIIAKVFHILQSRYELNKSLSVDLYKKIPHGAGLGGGSSNAATFLNLADELFSLNLPMKEKIDIMSQVGSDTVFFLYDKPMIGTSKGEILYDAPTLPILHILLIKPTFSVSTQKAYSNKNLRLTQKYEISKIKGCDGICSLIDLMENDLETPVFSLHPELSSLKSMIESFGALKAMMSGSGSTVYGIFSSSKKLDAAHHWFSNRFKNFFVYKTYNI